MFDNPVMFPPGRPRVHEADERWKRESRNDREPDPPHQHL